VEVIEFVEYNPVPAAGLGAFYEVAEVSLSTGLYPLSYPLLGLKIRHSTQPVVQRQIPRSGEDWQERECKVSEEVVREKPEGGNAEKRAKKDL
jgi:hypothetical protein